MLALSFLLPLEAETSKALATIEYVSLSGLFLYSSTICEFLNSKDTILFIVLGQILTRAVAVRTEEGI